MITEAGRWRIDHDPEATRARYAQLPIGTGCTCSDCTNFIESALSLFPPEFQSLATSLGVDLLKPAELCHYGEEEDGRLFIGGWFHLIGQILFGTDAFHQVNQTTFEHDFEQLTTSCSFGFTNRLALVSPVFSDPQVVQLEFHLRTHAAELRSS